MAHRFYLTTSAIGCISKMQFRHVVCQTDMTSSQSSQTRFNGPNSMRCPWPIACSFFHWIQSSAFVHICHLTFQESCSFFFRRFRWSSLIICIWGVGSGRGVCRATLSAASLPCISLCPGIHWRVIWSPNGFIPLSILYERHLWIKGSLCKTCRDDMESVKIIVRFPWTLFSTIFCMALYRARVLLEKQITLLEQWKILIDRLME